VLGGSVGLFYWAYNIAANQPLAMLALVLFAGVALSLLLTLIAAAFAFFLSRRFEPVLLQHCEVGREYRQKGPVVHPILALLTAMQVEWQAQEPANKAVQIDATIDASGRENVRFDRRCLIRLLRRVVKVGDRFGLFRLAIEQTLPVQIVVLPRKKNYKRASFVGSATDLDMRPDLSGAAEGDLIETRQYQEGESAKNMLWKVAARTGGQRLMVRTEERVTGGKVALYFMATGRGDDAAAEFIRYFTGPSGPNKDWILGVSGDHKVYEPSKKSRVLEAIAMTGAVENCDWTGMEAFVRRASSFGVRTAAVVVGGEHGEKSRDLLSKVAARAKGSTILFCPLEKKRSAASLPGGARLIYPDGGGE
jgi:hypothetical protein